MSPQSLRSLPVGSAGSFHILSTGKHRDADAFQVLNESKGTFEVVQVSSRYFVAQWTLEDGTVKDRVYCDFPKNSKDGVESVEWTENGYRAISEWHYPEGGISRTVRKYSFEPVMQVA